MQYKRRMIVVPVFGYGPQLRTLRGKQLESLCYDLITQVTTLGLRLEDELRVREREYTID